MAVHLRQAHPLEAYLTGDDLIEVDHPEILTVGARLRGEHSDDRDFAAAAFAWVRDEVAHSLDVQDPRVTLRATDVLRERVGLCYAKSVLLAAILRGQGIATALCFQRLADGAGGYAVHGLVAVHLDGAWHRQDPRGNKPGVAAAFSLEREVLAFEVDPDTGEADYPDLHATVPREIVSAIAHCTDILSCVLPDSLE